MPNIKIVFVCNLTFVLQEGMGTLYNAADDRLGVVSPQFGGRSVRRGLEMGPPSSPVVTSYRLTIYRIGLSLTVSQCSDLSRTDRRTEIV